MQINKKNTSIILIYLCVLALTLFGYLFMVCMHNEGYNPEIYKNGYMYFMVFQFILFSVLIPHWEQSICINVKKTLDILYGYVNVFLQLLLMCISVVPLILVIFIFGQISYMNFLLPLVIQAVWGMLLISICSLIEKLNISENFKYLIVHLIIFVVLIMSLVFLYYYHEYGQIVLTTVYDKDIPLFFFLNPILSIGGFVYYEIGNSNQLGMVPVIYNLVFNFILISIISIVNLQIVKHRNKKSDLKLSE